MKITPIILSGGSGTRLWPISRTQNPKQFLDFFGKNSLFQKTALRAKNSEFFNSPIAICNNDHRFSVAEELQKLNIAPKAIMLEPIGRNTAPAVAVCALEVLAQNGDEDDLMLVMPSDHIIKDEKKFISHINEAKAVASDGYLVTFGIEPNKAETGYGYIKQGAKQKYVNSFEVEKFVEKPDAKKAQEFLESGKYFWNSGIFMFKASVYLKYLRELQADIYENCQKSLKNSKKDLDFTRISANDFEKCQNISIDYAVMEKADKVAAVPINVDWSDVGSWQAIAEISEKDQDENSLIGDVKTLKTKNCYVNSSDKLVATIGVDNLIIIALKDVILVANKDNSQDVKKVFEELKSQKREECNSHPKVLRPWGSFETIEVSNRHKVKKIIVNPGESLSLQMHKHRAEHWVVVKGIAKVTCGEKIFNMNEDQSTYIPIEEKHRLENEQKTPLEIIEIQTGDYLGEDDIIRFEDIYGR